MLDNMTNGKSLRDVPVSIAMRNLNDESGAFRSFPSSQQIIWLEPENRIQITDIKKLDAQYVILVPMSSPEAASLGRGSIMTVQSSSTSTAKPQQVTISPGSSFLYRRRSLFPAAAGAMVAPFL